MSNRTIKFYDKNGNIVTKDSHECVAKESTNDETKKSRYYLKFNLGTLVDPRDGAFDRQKKNFKFRSVNQETFESYLKYLVKGGVSYFRTAERGVLNG